jgi:hypothetical protein
MFENLNSFDTRDMTYGETIRNSNKSQNIICNGLIKSSYYSPHSKEPNPQQAEQGHAQMQKCV